VEKFFARHQGGKPELSDCRMLQRRSAGGVFKTEGRLARALSMSG